MASTGYTPWSVTAGEQPTTAYWNMLGTNDASFNNGQGFNDDVIIPRHISNGTTYLQYAQITSSFTTTSTSAVQVTGMTITLTTQAGMNAIRLTAWCGGLYSTVASANIQMSIWDGTVGSGTQVSFAYGIEGGSSSCAGFASAIIPLAGVVTKTYNVGLLVTSGTGFIECHTYGPAYILAEGLY